MITMEATKVADRTINSLRRRRQAGQDALSEPTVPSGGG